MFNYKPLLKLLVEKEMTKSQLRITTGMSMATLAKISKNEYISMETLDKKYNHLLCHSSHRLKPVGFLASLI